MMFSKRFVAAISCPALLTNSKSGTKRLFGCLSTRLLVLSPCPHVHRCDRCSTAPPRSEEPETNNRMIPKIKSEVDEMKKRKFSQPAEARFLSVSILGTPNSGKSTLTNMLMGWRVCSVSKKVHTTKHNTKAVLVDGNKQIVFLDTPGLVSLAEKRRHHLDWAMLTDPKSSLEEADLVITLVDVSNLWTRHKIDPKILELLERHKNKHSVLVLNKVDLLKSKKLLLDLTTSLTGGVVNGIKTHAPMKTTHALSVEAIIKRTERMLQQQQEGLSSTSCNTPGEQKEQVGAKGEREEEEEVPVGWPHFKEVFMVSALLNHGVADLRKYLLEATSPGKWRHNPGVVTDQEPQEIAIMAVREKLMDTLPAEIPYNIDLKVEIWQMDEQGALRIAMQVNCPMKHHVKIVIGPQGKTVSQIAREARQELMNSFHCEVSLKLIVQHIEDKKK